jgi:hypothetical protein
MYFPRQSKRGKAPRNRPFLGGGCQFKSPSFQRNTFPANLLGFFHMRTTCPGKSGLKNPCSRRIGLNGQSRAFVFSITVTAFNDTRLGKARIQNSTLRLAASNRGACSGLTLSGAFIPRLKTRGLAPSNGSKKGGKKRFKTKISSPKSPDLSRNNSVCIFLSENLMINALYGLIEIKWILS